MSSWVTLPAHVLSGMILQQQASFRLSGQTDPNLKLTIELTCFPYENHAISPLDPNYGVVYSVDLVSDSKGAFSFELPPFKASFDPYELKISDGVRILQFQDILYGEVFLFMGDDTLHTPFSLSGLASSSGDQYRIPFLRLFDMQLKSPSDHWLAANEADNIGLFSAVGLLFGRELVIELKIPVGLIQSVQPGHKLHDWRPAHKSGLFGNLLQPLQNLGLRGIVWSGSARDLDDPNAARNELMKLAQKLRTLFLPVDGQLPAFLMLQQPTSYAGQKCFYHQTLSNESLAYALHHLEAPAALVPVSGTTPANRLTVIASRLRTICLGLLFQRKAPQSAPECESIELVGGKMILSFSNAGDGLRLTGDETRVRGFAVCGNDHVYREASARVLYGVRVMVWHDDIPNPTGVTYGFYDLNQRANLISKDQLPVVPFRSDQVESVYCLPQEWLHCDETDGWQVYDGKVDLQREKVNKSEGEASLRIMYQAESESKIAFGPVIDLPTAFPPLDLQRMDRLMVDLFNPDRQEKSIQLSLMAIAAPGAKEATTRQYKIEPALRWQTIKFDLDQLATDLDLSQIIKLKLIITDRTGRGLVYLDNIRFGYR